MAQTRYPSIAEVIAIHEYILRKLGEAPEGLRDEGLLESAIMRPQMAAWYEGANLIRQGTLLAIGISQAQAFVDGNKRTAFATLDAFLLVNDWEITGDPLDLARQLEGFAHRSSDPTALDDFEAWLRANVRERAE
jgi:death-on-curing protein